MGGAKFAPPKKKPAGFYGFENIMDSIFRVYFRLDGAGAASRSRSLGNVGAEKLGMLTVRVNKYRDTVPSVEAHWDLERG